MGVEYRCKCCKQIVPRGWRMVSCECGAVSVDWGTGSPSTTIRVHWQGGAYEDIVEQVGEEPA